MIIPRYYFGADYISFEEYLLQECDSIQHFPKGSFLNGTDIDYNTIYYILDGLGQFYILHESGKRSIISIHGYGTIYPLFRDLDGGEYPLKQYKLEGNLFFQAITDMKVAAFSYETMSRLITSNSKFCHRSLQSYLNYINLLLYRVTTSDHDDAEKKVCNYLFSMHYYGKQLVVGNQLFVTQEDIADFLGLTRTHVSRILKRLIGEEIISIGRKSITINDINQLLNHCSSDIKPE